MESPVERKLKELEERITALEGGSPTNFTGDLVHFSGNVTVGPRTYQYEWARPAQKLTDDLFHDSLERATALAHPIRHRILRMLIDGPASVTDLVAAGISSSGTAYHHLGALQAAGWVTKRDGNFEIPVSRMVPLLVIVAACEDHR
ncbi:winged helix-turn-helix domain-containing protein [Staphylococcus chromogenes]|nr:winged helix-turn-helix domain-containing protein [Staphylococcus chromogenes]